MCRGQQSKRLCSLRRGMRGKGDTLGLQCTAINLGLGFGYTSLGLQWNPSPPAQAYSCSAARHPDAFSMQGSVPRATVIMGDAYTTNKRETF